MSIFDDLNAEYKTWRDTWNDERIASARFPGQFVEGLKSYIEAPDTFEEDLGSGERKKRLPYIRALKILDRDDGTYDTEEANFHELVTRRDDGYYGFAVSVALEIASNTWPKQYFAVPVYFFFGADRNTAKLKIADSHDGEHNYDTTDNSKNIPAYEYVVRLIRNILRTKPSDIIDNKRPIGFAFPNTKNDEPKKE